MDNLSILKSCNTVLQATLRELENKCNMVLQTTFRNGKIMDVTGCYMCLFYNKKEKKQDVTGCYIPFFQGKNNVLQKFVTHCYIKTCNTKDKISMILDSSTFQGLCNRSTSKYNYISSYNYIIITSIYYYFFISILYRCLPHHI